MFLRVTEILFQETVDSAVQDETTEILEEIKLVDHSSLTVAEDFVAEFVEQIIKEKMHSVSFESC